MPETVLVDDLLSSNPSMRVKDKAKVEALLQALNTGGLDKLQVIADFDYTLTKSKNDKGLLDCSWGVLENTHFLSDSYTTACNALKKKYLPIEVVRITTKHERTRNNCSEKPIKYEQLYKDFTYIQLLLVLVKLLV